MALPVDFWRNEQLVNIFRTKPCNRLLRDGVCEWRNQCQFSHNLDWPRRPPQKHRYTPELCAQVQLSRASGAGSKACREDVCAAGLRCIRAHSKEEVLYHPQIFKTILCEEHARAVQSLATRGPRSSYRARCHRYYCPFAHGQQELRSSSLPQQQREQCVRALCVFPHDVCCEVCDPHSIDREGDEQDEADGQWGAAQQEVVYDLSYSSQGGQCSHGSAQMMVPVPRGAAPGGPVQMMVPVPGGAAPGGCGMATSMGSMDSSGQHMQLVQVVPPALSGPGSLGLEASAAENASVMTLLCDCGLECFSEAVQGCGLDSVEALARCHDSELVQLGIPADDVARLQQSAEQCLQKQGAQADHGSMGAMCMVPVSGPGGTPGMALVVNGYGQWMAAPAPWAQVAVQPGIMPNGHGQAAAIFIPQPLPAVPPFPTQNHQQPQHPLQPQQQQVGAEALEQPEQPLSQTPRAKLERVSTPSDDGFEYWRASPEKTAQGPRWPNAAPAEVK